MSGLRRYVGCHDAHIIAGGVMDFNGFVLTEDPAREPGSGAGGGVSSWWLG